VNTTSRKTPHKLPPHFMKIPQEVLEAVNVLERWSEVNGLSGWLVGGVCDIRLLDHPEWLQDYNELKKESLSGQEGVGGVGGGEHQC